MATVIDPLVVFVSDTMVVNVSAMEFVAVPFVMLSECTLVLEVDGDDDLDVVTDASPLGVLVSVSEEDVVAVALTLEVSV